MEELAKILIFKLDMLCITYHYGKKTVVFEGVKEMAADIQEFTGTLLEGIRVGDIEDEDGILRDYITQVLKDYIEAVKYRDSVLMIDTLDYGLRELLNIVAEEEDGDES